MRKRHLPDRNLYVAAQAGERSHIGHGERPDRLGGSNPIEVSISQFYGIEINDFACAVAQMALWIAQAQTLLETEQILSLEIEYLPLDTAAHIVEGNALRMDWNQAVPASQVSYVLGNPPFSGARIMTKSQKRDVQDTFGSGWKNAGNLDYVACWFKKATDYIAGTDVHVAFVATNSICQGESVANLWGPSLPKTCKSTSPGAPSAGTARRRQKRTSTWWL